MVINGKEIERLIRKEKLIDSYVDLEKQITPNGFDLTAGKIFIFKKAGSLDFSNKERILSAVEEVKPFKKSPREKCGWWMLKKGAYKIVTNEVCNIPNYLMGIAFPRSSLLRMGAFTQTAIWDAGFAGKSEFILLVENPYGIKIRQNARIVQLIFLKIKGVREGYRGIYKN